MRIQPGGKIYQADVKMKRKYFSCLICVALLLSGCESSNTNINDNKPDSANRPASTPLAENTVSNWATYTSTDGRSSIRYPSDWEIREEKSVPYPDYMPGMWFDVATENNVDMLVVARNGYELIIFQNAVSPSSDQMPAGFCSYTDSDEADFPTPDLFYYLEHYDDFTDIDRDEKMAYRRSKAKWAVDSRQAWVLCQYSPRSDMSDTILTPVTNIIYLSPLNFDENILKSMDQILLTNDWFIKFWYG